MQSDPVAELPAVPDGAAQLSFAAEPLFDRKELRVRPVMAAIVPADETAVQRTDLLTAALFEHGANVGEGHETVEFRLMFRSLFENRRRHLLAGETHPHDDRAAAVFEQRIDGGLFRQSGNRMAAAHEFVIALSDGGISPLQLPQLNCDFVAKRSVAGAVTDAEHGGDGVLPPFSPASPQSQQHVEPAAVDDERAGADTVGHPAEGHQSRRPPREETADALLLFRMVPQVDQSAAPLRQNQRFVLPLISGNQFRPEDQFLHSGFAALIEFVKRQRQSPVGGNPIGQSNSQLPGDELPFRDFPAVPCIDCGATHLSILIEPADFTRKKHRHPPCLKIPRNTITVISFFLHYTQHFRQSQAEKRK